MRDIFNLFFKATGYINQKMFVFGAIGLFIFVEAMKFTVRAMLEGIAEFWVLLIYPLLALYMICCVYGKRLHDMGFSWWPLTGAFSAEILATICVMLAFGGTEYFEAFSQYERKAVIDPSVRDAIIADYQATQAANIVPITIMLLIIPVLFTIWLACSKSKVVDNPFR